MAVTMLRCVVVTKIRPKWLGFEGPEVSIGKVCQQGGAERPAFWNMVPDAALSGVCRQWQGAG